MDEEAKRQVFKAVAEDVEMEGQMQIQWCKDADTFASDTEFCAACASSLEKIWNETPGNELDIEMWEARHTWESIFRHYAVKHALDSTLVILEFDGGSKFKCKFGGRAKDSELWHRLNNYAEKLGIYCNELGHLELEAELKENREEGLID